MFTLGFLVGIIVAFWISWHVHRANEEYNRKERERKKGPKGIRISPEHSSLAKRIVRTLRERRDEKFY